MSGLFPTNVTALQEAGIEAKWVRTSRHLIVACPCGGRLYIDEEKPFAWCYGLISCRFADLPIDKMIEKLRHQPAQAEK